MDLVIRVDAGLRDAESRSLREWLVAEPVLRGQVRVVEEAPPAGTLGAVVDVLTVALGPGGITVAVASVIIAWIRRRFGDVRVTMTRPDGVSVTVDAKQLRGLDQSGVAELVADVARTLDGRAKEPGDATG